MNVPYVKYEKRIRDGRTGTLYKNIIRKVYLTKILTKKSLTYKWKIKFHHDYILSENKERKYYFIKMGSIV